MNVDIKNHFFLLNQIRINDYPSREEIAGLNLTVDSGVWNPARDPGSKMFASLLANYSYQKIESVLDMGTGCGILALTINKIGIFKITASDISPKALDNTSANSVFNNAGHIKLIDSNLFENIEEKYDLIVFNPPIIPSLVLKNHNGLIFKQKRVDLYKNFLKDLKKYLTPQGKALILVTKFENFDPLPPKAVYKLRYRFKEILKEESTWGKSSIFEISPK
ncbi:MAG: methyltransferase [Candidatus Moranbacteria bacterium]|nr:methyltransferase [Candidatus Moranbacteria bacterium]